MEFALDLKSQILVFPKGTSITSKAPGGKPGMTFNVDHGFVGLNGLNTQMISDGINDKGVYFGALYLPGFTKYQEVPVGKENLAVTPIDVGMYLLGTSGSVAEAKENIKRILVWPEVTAPVNILFPLHFSVQDKTGAAAVFEYVNGQLNIYDNELGVVTNSPPFDWHLINLRNYVNLSPDNALGKNLSGTRIVQIGEGSGMLGLPGDPTPPSRFVRAVAITQCAFKADDEVGATKDMMHVMNNFDLVKGVSRGLENGDVTSDYTQWTTIADLTNLNFLVRMWEKPEYVQISFKDLDFNTPGVRTIDPNTPDWFKKLV